MQTTYDNIMVLVDDYCQKKLDGEYLELCQKALAALSRKRPSPLEGGRINTWACATIHAIGMVNFLFDKSFSPYVSATDLANDFGLGKSTVASKSRQIRGALKMSQFDHRWMVTSRIYKSPTAWMISINGFIVDARTMPIEIQSEAYEKGLIPGIVENSV